MSDFDAVEKAAISLDKIVRNCFPELVGVGAGLNELIVYYIGRKEPPVWIPEIHEGYPVRVVKTGRMKLA